MFNGCLFVRSLHMCGGVATWLLSVGLLDVWWVGCFSGSWGCCFKIFRTSRVGILPEMFCCCICCHEIGLQYGYFLATITTSCLILWLTGQEKRKACLCFTVNMGGHDGRWTTGTLGFDGPKSKKSRGCTRLCIGRFLLELSGNSNDKGEICTMTTGGHIPITR